MLGTNQILSHYVVVEVHTEIYYSALSALFKVDGALGRVSGRVGGENDCIYYAGKRGIYQILKK